MRKFILLLLLTAIARLITAQNTDTILSKNEIGTLLFGLRNNLGQEYPMQSTFFNGIEYKRYFNKSAIRAGVDYRNRYKKEGPEFETTSGYKETRIRIGFQRSFGNKIIKPYLATDIILVKTISQSETFPGAWLNPYEKQYLRYWGIGLAPALGINVKLTTTLSLSIETNFEILWVNKQGTKTINNKATEINSKEFVNRINPINIFSLNYRF